MTIRVILIAAILLAPGIAIAKIYTWVDEHGQKHFGDHVPAKYRKKSKTVELNTRQPSANDVEQTRHNVLDEQAAGNLLQRRRSGARSHGPGGTIVRPSSGRPRGPGVSQSDYKKMSCQEKWKVYKQSDACYAKCAVVSSSVTMVEDQYDPHVKVNRGRSTAGCDACGHYLMPPPCNE